MTLRCLRILAYVGISFSSDHRPIKCKMKITSNKILKTRKTLIDDKFKQKWIPVHKKAEAMDLPTEEISKTN